MKEILVVLSLNRERRDLTVIAVYAAENAESAAFSVRIHSIIAGNYVKQQTSADTSWWFDTFRSVCDQC